MVSGRGKRRAKEKDDGLGVVELERKTGSVSMRVCGSGANGGREVAPGALAHPIVHPPDQPCARARARQVRRWRTVVGMMSGMLVWVLCRAYTYGHTYADTQARSPHVYTLLRSARAIE